MSRLTKNIDLKKIKSILLIELNRFGDVVHALPAARCIKIAAPDAHLSMLVERPLHDLVTLEPHVDRILDGRETRTLRGLLQTIREIRAERFDLVCSLSPIRRNAWATLAAKGGYKAGYLSVWRRIPPHLRRSPVTAKGFNLKSEEMYGYEHISMAPLKVCSAMGIPVEEEAFCIQPAERGDDLIPQNSYIVFHPFAGWEFREWPARLVREFLSLFLGSTNLSIVIISNGAEGERARALADGPEYEGRVQVRVGISVADLIALLTHAAGFVGTDSGPYQLCALLGKPAVGLFGPNTPQISGSRVRGSKIVYHRLDCSPCSQMRCIRPDVSCMSLVAPAEVLENLRGLLHQ